MRVDVVDGRVFDDVADSFREGRQVRASTVIGG